jgi:hypothetical protein
MVLLRLVDLDLDPEVALMLFPARTCSDANLEARGKQLNGKSIKLELR